MLWGISSLKQIETKSILGKKVNKAALNVTVTQVLVGCPLIADLVVPVCVNGVMGEAL